MKYLLGIFLWLAVAQNGFAQNSDQAYARAMAAYEHGQYAKASMEFSIVFKQQGYKLSSRKLYDGACIYALNGEYSWSMAILFFLANDKYYTDLAHLKKDPDLEKLHNLAQWTELLHRVEINQQTQPERTRVEVKMALKAAKEQLLNDRGRLWGEVIWSDDILVLGKDNTIYSLKQLPGGTTLDSVIYTKKIPAGTLGQTNSLQKYEGKDCPVVLTNYLSDSSATIIHELFHGLHLRHQSLNGNPINYLDEYQAREWLRLEYQALKNALEAVRTQKKKAMVSLYLTDAMVYRKLRQHHYRASLDDELQIETLEGLANYTGFKLSTHLDKYAVAINEINMRESAPTYTRTFPYATGPAYGLLFDYLQMDWKMGLGKVYDFLARYETVYLHHPISTAPGIVASANRRNNFKSIHEQELMRKKGFDRKITHFTDLFEHKPTLRVSLKDSLYQLSYDMNGTVTLKDKGIVYSSITGTDKSGRNFGNFKLSLTGEQKDAAGILGDFGNRSFVFPLPVKVEGDKIVGLGFEIQLNKGWLVRQVNEKGDLEIVNQ